MSKFDAEKLASEMVDVLDPALTQKAEEYIGKCLTEAYLYGMIDQLNQVEIDINLEGKT